MARYGIVPEFSFVLGNPPDPEADVAAARSSSSARSSGSTRRTEIILYLYTPVPLAGELYDQAKAEGFAFPETLEEWIGPGVAGVLAAALAPRCPGCRTRCASASATSSGC